MKNWAVVRRLDPHIEEEVTLEMNGVEFTGFANICPYPIEMGHAYPVSIGITILDDVIIQELSEPKKELERIDSGFAYNIRGVIQADSLDAGIVLTDEELFRDYAYLIDTYVEMKVDRISVEFLAEREGE